MDVLSVSSLKGGVGKTTVALGLASAALARGRRTLLVDIDPQTDLTTGLAVDPGSALTIADVLRNPSPDVVRQAIVSSAWTKDRALSVDVLVGSPRAIEFDAPAPRPRDLWKLDEALALIEDAYDIVIIDCPPSLNALTRNAWLASDEVLIVTEPSLFAVSAVGRAFKAMDELSEAQDVPVRALGVLVNRFRKQSIEHEFRVSELEQLYPRQLIDVRLPERASLQQAQGSARPVHSWPSESGKKMAAQFDQVLDIFEDAVRGIAHQGHGHAERRAVSKADQHR
ncbi:ParA family protein [Pseudoclavibacter caeni]|uniref:ParA family protein n=1 Tax=Pseudoclavibacter caeni TaxID=908846 RepID=A0A7C8BP90_9MICO|nr:ParA family protein [Pseudoclavibacter caeni]KAB1632995.1 ParA family protein [Pseudoclavibacter caeni]NYJ97026.1 cellulose biosynthesis protein BcsQ [Pseudoclavibacter caeni]